MGDTARFGGARASYHVLRHDARALRWRRQSSWDNNGTPREAGDRASPGTRVRTEQEAFASGVTRPGIGRVAGRRRRRSGIVGSPCNQLCHCPIDVGSERRKCCPIGLRTDPNDDVGGNIGWKQARPGEFSQAAFHSVASYRRLMKSWDDQPDASSFSYRKHVRGSDDPNLEQRGSDTLPLLRNTLQIRASCDARTSRKPERRVGRVRLRRTCPGCGP
jgi:hypothetical protein